MPTMQLYSHHTPYLERYPALEAIEDPRLNEIAFPGPDGNTTLLLYRLIQYRVIDLNEDNYLAIKKLLEIDSRLITSEQFHELLLRFNRLTIPRHSHYQNVVILGRLLSGASGNDYFSIKLLNIIREKSLGRLNFRILLGVNEYEFLSHLKAIQTIHITPSNFGGCESAVGSQAKLSTRHFATLLDRQLIQQDEFHQIVKNLIENYLHFAWSSFTEQNRLNLYSPGFLSQTKFGALRQYFPDLEISTSPTSEFKLTLHRLIESLNNRIKNPKALFELHHFFFSEYRIKRNSMRSSNSISPSETYPLFYLASDRSASLNENRDPQITSVHANVTHIGGFHQVSLSPSLQFTAYITSTPQASYAASSGTTPTQSFANHPINFGRQAISLKPIKKPIQRPNFSRLHILEGKLSALPKPLPIHAPNNTDYRICVFGDGHGNAIKLFQFLILHNIFECSEEIYRAIFNFYSRSQENVEPIHLIEIKTLIDTLKVVPSDFRVKIIALGDLLCDRGLKDWLTLVLLERLSKEKAIEVSVTISNHDAEFLRRYRKAKMIFDTKNVDASPDDVLREKLAQALESPITIAQSQTVCSIFSLANWIRRGILNFSEVISLLETAYLPTLKQFDFELVGNQILLFGHAPVGLEYYRALAEHLGQVFHSSTASRLLRSLRELKQATLLSNHEQLFSYLQRLEQEPFTREINPTTSPRNYGIWNRSANFINLDRLPSDFQLILFHGHDDRRAFPEGFNRFYICLDDQYGKSPDALLSDQHEGDFRSYQSAVTLPEPQTRSSLASEQSSTSIPSVESSSSLASESPSQASSSAQTQSLSNSQKPKHDIDEASSYHVTPPPREILPASAIRRMMYTQRQASSTKLEPAQSQLQTPKPKR